MKKIAVEMVIRLLWFCTLCGICSIIILVAMHQEYGQVGAATVLSVFTGVLMKSLLDWILKKIRDED